MGASLAGEGVDGPELSAGEVGVATGIDEATTVDGLAGADVEVELGGGPDGLATGERAPGVEQAPTTEPIARATAAIT
jgi:hypothetical protein